MPGSTSQTTSMRFTASSAISTVSAATAAMASPRNRARSCGKSQVCGWQFEFTGVPGMSSAVTTAATPGMAFASVVSMDTMRAW